MRHTNDDPLNATAKCLRCWGGGFVRADLDSDIPGTYCACPACGGCGTLPVKPRQPETVGFAPPADTWDSGQVQLGGYFTGL